MGNRKTGHPATPSPEWCDGDNETNPYGGVAVWCVFPVAPHAGHWKNTVPQAVDPTLEQESDEPENLSPVNLREKDWIYRYIDAWMEENLEKAIDDYFDKKRANHAWSEEQQAVERYWRLTLDGPRSPRALDVALVPDGWLGITGGQFNRMYDVERQHLVWVRV
jgi:hypothetical protein